MQKRFSKYAQGYVSSQTHAKGKELERLVEISIPQPAWIGLDVATGGGHTALTFARHVNRVVAADLTPKMLQTARTHIKGKGIENIDFAAADAEYLPFCSEAFHIVTCRIAPHHFPNCFGFVRESARVLKPGGLLVVQDHLLPGDESAASYIDAFEMLRDPTHNRAFTEEQWKSMFQDAGLRVTEMEEIVKRHEIIPWADRQGCTAAVIERLNDRILTAPEEVVRWMQPEHMGTPEASFVNHHIIIVGIKDG